MKTSRLLMLISAILIAVVSLTITTSCSKDDDASVGKIVGTWVRESASDGKETYIFKADGTAIHKVTGQSDTTFKYSFNEATSEITITEDGETWTEHIKFLSSTSFEWDGIFYKQ